MNRAEAQIDELWRRILRGEDPDAVVAELAQRDACARATTAETG